MSVGRFIAGIGVLLMQEESCKVLLLKRASTKDFAQGVWECVTGRVDQGESFETAAYREVFEELGVTEFRLIQLLGTTHFFRGEALPKNELVGVIYLGLIDDQMPIRLSDEHSEFRWLSFNDACELLNDEKPPTRWIRRVIARAEQASRFTSPEMIEFNARHGFELG